MISSTARLKYTHAVERTTNPGELEPTNPRKADARANVLNRSPAETRSLTAATFAALRGDCGERGTVPVRPAKEVCAIWRRQHRHDDVGLWERFHECFSERFLPL